MNAPRRRMCPRSPLVAAVVLWVVLAGTADRLSASPTPDMPRLGRDLAGRLIDYTDHHGADHRVWSRALCRPRNLYLYLPPGFCPGRQYPCMMWMHGINEDERDSVNKYLGPLDRAIASGCLPPMIIAMPDGSIRETDGLLHRGSFYLNTDAGRFEDYVFQDVWGFVVSHYPVRPEREAHVLAGVSMGGLGAYHTGLNHRHEFGVLLGIHPPLNLRYVNGNGRYWSRFDPSFWGFRDHLGPWELMGRFYLVVTIRMRDLVYPLWDRSRDIVTELSLTNPTEMIIREDIRPGEFAMFVGYGGKDQFNIAAQVESFLFVAKGCKGLPVTVTYLPAGKHDTTTALMILPSAVAWLALRLEPFRVSCGSGDAQQGTAPRPPGQAGPSRDP